MLKSKIALAAAGVLMVGAVGATTASARLATDTSNKSISQDCLESTTGQVEGTFVWEGPMASWPPNHKDETATITLFDSDDEPATDEVSLAVVPTHDEILENGTELNGSGNTSPTPAAARPRARVRRPSRCAGAPSGPAAAMAASTRSPRRARPTARWRACRRCRPATP